MKDSPLVAALTFMAILCIVLAMSVVYFRSESEDAIREAKNVAVRVKISGTKIKEDQVLILKRGTEGYAVIPYVATIKIQVGVLNEDSTDIIH